LQRWIGEARVVDTVRIVVGRSYVSTSVLELISVLGELEELFEGGLGRLAEDVAAVERDVAADANSQVRCVGR
jgi:hypothetical protein